MSTPLPLELARLLDDATSEAKRYGHGQVSPAHLAIVLARTRSDDPASAVLAQEADAYLRGLPKTYDTPVVLPETEALLESGAAAADPGAAVAASVDAFLDGVAGPTAAPSGGAAGDDAPPADGATSSDGASPADDGAAAPVRPEVLAPEAGTTAVAAPADPLEAAGIAIPGWARAAVDLVPADPPVVPRDDVARRLTALLRARLPQTPVVVAGEGQGRSSVAACLAAFLASGAAPAPLAGMPVVRTRAEQLLTSNREGGLAAILGAARGKAVVVVDDLEVLCSLGSGSGVHASVLSVLRGTLHDPEARVVLGVASQFVDRLQAADTEFFDELERVDLPPLTADEVGAVAAHEAVALAAFHGVTIPDDVVAAALAPPRQIDGMAHPGLAVHRLDRAAAAATMRDDRTAQAADLGPAVAAQQYVAFDPAAARTRLALTIVGQDDALDAVTRRLAVTRASLDLRPERPDGVFLFAGPTGTGKTALALALAQELFGTQEAVVRLDMSEYAEPHTVAKLVGSPPGYVGSTEPESWLTTRIRRRPQCVMLLDEIEKAHPQVWNTFLQVFDAGRLTDSQGRVADFRDVVCVLTTNIGSDVFDTRQGAGFVEASGSPAADRRAVVERLKTWMAPELLNRLDEILVFRPLGPDDVRAIAERRLGEVLAAIALRGWAVECGDDVVDLIAARGYDPQYGARPLIRAIEAVLLEPLSLLPPGAYRATAVDGALAFAPAAPAA